MLLKRNKLTMGILNNLNHRVLIIIMLLVSTYVCGLAKNQNDVDSIRITFGHLDGYAICRITVCYAYDDNAYKLQIEKPSDLHPSLQLPKTISKISVSKLLNDCSLYSTEDRCEFIKITKDDYSNYIKIIDNKDSLDSYLPFLFDFNKDQYELEENAFLSLRCSEIITIIESPYHMFAHYKPLLKIDLISKDAGKITIEPQWYFDGTAWMVLSHGKKKYVANEYLISFLKDIKYDKYVYLYERFYILFQIAETLVNQGRRSF